MKLVLPTLHVRASAQSVPLAAAGLAAALPPALRSACRLLELFPERTPAQMLAAILAEGPDLVAFPLYLWNRGAVLELCRQLKIAAPGLRIVLGGPEASADAAGVLGTAAVDGVLRGEGELAFPALLRVLEGGGDWESVPGLSWRRRGEPVHNPQGPLPTPAELVSPWVSGVLTPPPGGGVLWEVSRGCPFNCDFCFDGRGSQGVRPLPWARLQAELELFVEAGVSQVWVLDSTFNFPAERGKQLLRLLAKQAPRIHFHLEAKADFLDRDTARLLGKLSCSVQVGLQSARPEILRRVRRRHDPVDFGRKLALLQAAGVAFGLDLIYGLPGDDHAGFRHSLQVALQLGPNHLDLFPLAVLPGTTLSRQRQQFGLEAEAAPPYEIRHSDSYSAAELAASRRLAAAADLFYNRGRAVGFFEVLLSLSGEEAVPFLEQFWSWALGPGQLSEARLLASENWQPEAILPLQLGFMEYLLNRRRTGKLLPVLRDLLTYHFHYAETLLGAETLPPQRPPSPKALRQGRWRLAPTLRLVDFTYEIAELLSAGLADLAKFAARHRPVGSTALLLRRGGEVVCESLSPEMVVLLRGCDGRRPAAAVATGAGPRAELEELLAFAVAEGLLLAATTTN